jgi:hypothetical protein
MHLSKGQPGPDWLGIVMSTLQPGEELIVGPRAPGAERGAQSRGVTAAGNAMASYPRVSGDTNHNEERNEHKKKVFAECGSVGPFGAG